MRLIIVLLGSIAIAPRLSAQYSLQQCIEIALESNLDIRLSQLNITQAQIAEDQSRMQLSPTLNGNFGQFYQSGRSIDRFTNQFVQSTVGNTSLQIQGGWTLFSGGRIMNGLKQSKMNTNAAKLDHLQNQQSIVLNVALAYLSCLQTKEQVKAAELNAATLLQDLKRVEKTFALGAANEGTVFAAKAQWSAAQANLSQVRNQHLNALLMLKNMLLIPREESFDIQTINETTPETLTYPISAQEMIDTALSRRPDYKASQLKVQSAQLGIKIAKGAYSPTLSIGGNLSSVYSDNAKSITGYNVTGTQPIGFVQGTNEIVEAPTFEYTASTIDFSKQLKDNFGQSFGATLRVPIYNQFQNRNDISRSKVALIQSEINAERIKQNIINDVMNALQSFENASSQFQAMRENYESQKKNLDFVQIRFNNGQASYYELQLAKNNEVAAEQNYISSKYECILRKMILDYMFTNDYRILTEKAN